MKGYAIFFLLLVALVFGLSLASLNYNEKPLSYTELLSLLHSGKADQIAKVIVTNGKSTVQVKMVSDARLRSVIVPAVSLESLIAELNKDGIKIDVKDEDKSSFWFSMFSSFFLPLLLLVGFLFMFRKAQSQTMNSRHSSAETIKKDDKLSPFDKTN